MSLYSRCCKFLFKTAQNKRDQLNDLLKGALQGSRADWLVFLDLLEEEMPKLNEELQILNGNDFLLDRLIILAKNNFNYLFNTSSRHIEFLTSNVGGFNGVSGGIFDKKFIYSEYNIHTNFNDINVLRFVSNAPKLNGVEISRMQTISNKFIIVELNNGIVNYVNSEDPDFYMLSNLINEKVVKAKEGWNKLQDVLKMPTANYTEAVQSLNNCFQKIGNNLSLDNLLKKTLLGDRESWLVFLDLLEEEMPEVRNELQRLDGNAFFIDRLVILGKNFKKCIDDISENEVLFKCPTVGGMGIIKNWFGLAVYYKFYYVDLGSMETTVEFLHKLPSVGFNEDEIRDIIRVKMGMSGSSLVATTKYNENYELLEDDERYRQMMGIVEPLLAKAKNDYKALMETMAMPAGMGLEMVGEE